MSKAKPWPTVANRHRIDCIFKSGEIGKSTDEITESLLPQLQEAIADCNISLALAITAAIEGQSKFIREASRMISQTLETAPSENGSTDDG